uniref:Pentatricopeptide repeat-containing protein At4g18840-like n=1 Tax=Elaeis guineensis var. tenera TaxID=51953 RepID=A0A8N4F9P5_ELAGV|nr:pentatricopeptide repeat-containing protein At4g18840-like [Elaeis guineensis]
MRERAAPSPASLAMPKRARAPPNPFLLPTSIPSPSYSSSPAFSSSTPPPPPPSALAPSTYNAMIGAHAIPSSPLNPLSLYAQMLGAGVRPDHLTFAFLKHCSLRLDSAAGQSLHAIVSKLGLHLDVFIENSMVRLYWGSGFIDSARRSFDEMLHRDIVSWNWILTGYLRGVELDLALRLILDMKDRNVITWNSIITGLCRVAV